MKDKGFSEHFKIENKNLLFIKSGILITIV